MVWTAAANEVFIVVRWVWLAVSSRAGPAISSLPWLRDHDHHAVDGMDVLDVLGGSDGVDGGQENYGRVEQG